MLRYGTMRQLVLGLEAVLPNGEVWKGLKRLRKDNTGYDLKQLLIGAEGTLGVVTAAALKLFPVLASRSVAMAGVESPGDAVALLARAKEVSGGAVESFELIGALGMALALRHIPGARAPLESRPPWYVLIEIASGEPGAAKRRWSGYWRAQWTPAWSRTPPSPRPKPRPRRSGPCARTSRRRRRARARPGSTTSPCRSRASPSSSSWPEPRYRRAGPACGSTPSAMSATGNIHYDVLSAPGGDPAVHNARREEAAHLVHDTVMSLEGSISAEHGLGTMKTAEALAYKSPVEVAAQQAVRTALDPKRIMNPRVLF